MALSNGLVGKTGLNTAARFFALIMLAQLFSLPSYAQNVLDLQDQQDGSLTQYAGYLPEGDKYLTISDVIAQQNQFIWYAVDNPNFGFVDNGVWIMFQVNNVSNFEEWVFSLNFSQLDKVDFYLVVDGEVVTQSHQGKLQSQQWQRRPAFRAHLPLASPVQLYIRIESQSSSLIAPIMATPIDEYVATSQVDSILWGVFYGALFILALYNLVLYFGVREISLLAYVGYIATVLIWQFVWGGHFQLLFDQGMPIILAGQSDLIFVVIGISSGLFSIAFLETSRNAPKTHDIIRAMLVAQAITGVLSVFDLLPHAVEKTLIYGVGMLAICSYILAGVEAYHQRFRPARYYIFAWSILASGALIGMASLLGALPSNTFTTYCFQVAVFIEAGLFSIALMEKSRSQLQNEVEQATNELRNNMELIEEQNARLDIARKDAIKASNVKSQFLANMSHEIRTPLNAILGFSKELHHADLSADKQEQVRIITSAADNLLTIVNDVLDFSKIEAGKLQINNQPFSPLQLLEEMVSMMAKSAHSKKLEFVFALDALPEKLIGDAFRIKQILNNLLSNALKFTPSGSITLAAYGRSLEHGLYELELVIEDTGIGISRRDRKKLFNAFSQIDDALNRSFQGTGLGLVICQELVRLMNGNLNLKSTPGQGSTFTVTIRTNQLSQKYCLSTHKGWQGKHVILFDPVPDTRRSGAAMLCAMGAKVTSIESAEALAMQNYKADYLFAVVPVSHRHRRDIVLTQLIKTPAHKRVLWYSGVDPIYQYPSLSEHFDAQLRMPLTPSKLENLIANKSRGEPKPIQNKLNSLPRVRILAVDDMDMNLRLLETWLETSPLHLTTSMNGQDAVNRCQTQEFDLILMDVQMPGMDGIQATRLIRQTPLNLGTPIIAVTAHAFKEEQERLLASGLDDYLPKPVDLNKLIELIKRWCQNTEHSVMTLPSVDWQQALKRANHNPSAAQELLAKFIGALPAAMDEISALWEQRHYNELLAAVHKLHGASLYTGVPRFQALADDLESALKLEKHLHVGELLPALLREAGVVVNSSQALLEEMRLGN